MFTKPVWFDALAASIESGDGWILSTCRLENPTARMEFWIGNGQASFTRFDSIVSSYNTAPSVPFLWRAKLWKSVKKLQDRRVLEALNKIPNESQIPQRNSP